MANVLSMLFGNIADAIREKTGDIATIAPANFPAEIGKIKVGGGSDGSMGASWKCYNGTYIPPTTSKVVLEHNIGAIPDIFYITTGSASDNYVLTSAMGFSSAMNAHIDDEKKGMAGIKVSNNIAMFFCSHDLETTNDEADTWGAPRNATATTITIGGGSMMSNVMGNMQGGQQYAWFAVCGIFGDIPSK